MRNHDNNFWAFTETYFRPKFKKSDNQTNIDKCRVAANIKEYYIISKLIFLKIIITKCMKKRQLFHVKINQKDRQNSNA